MSNNSLTVIYSDFDVFWYVFAFSHFEKSLCFTFYPDEQVSHISYIDDGGFSSLSFIELIYWIKGLTPGVIAIFNFVTLISFCKTKVWYSHGMTFDGNYKNKIETTTKGTSFSGNRSFVVAFYRLTSPPDEKLLSNFRSFFFSSNFVAIITDSYQKLLKLRTIFNQFELNKRKIKKRNEKLQTSPNLLLDGISVYFVFFFFVWGN